MNRLPWRKSIADGVTVENWEKRKTGPAKRLASKVRKIRAALGKVPVRTVIGIPEGMC